MISFSDFLLQYGALASIVTLTSAGAGVGGGIASRKALELISRAPSASNNIARVLVIGLALIETGSILGIVLALILLRTHPGPDVLVSAYTLSHIGMVFALGLTGFAVGICSAYALSAALYALVRQPLFSNKLTNMMLLTQTIIQTPLIFSFLVSLLIFAKLQSLHELIDGVKLLAAGICLGVGVLGPLIGLMRFAQAAMNVLAVNRQAYARVIPFSLISQAIIETPIIFALITSIIIAFIPASGKQGVDIVLFLSAALVMGVGTFGPGISSGATAAAACRQMTDSGETSSLLSKTSLIAQGIIDAATIYAFLVALMLLIL